MNKEQESQLKSLQRIYETMMPPTPVFKDYHESVPAGMIPYISCPDLHDYKFNIRAIPADDFFAKGQEASEKRRNGKIIAHYESMEELVEAGWKLD